jgi:hypothetical protein
MISCGSPPFEAQDDAAIQQRAQIDTLAQSPD